MGSDLDLLLVDAAADGPQHQRLLRWPLAQLPLSCDALVLSPSELEELLTSGSRMALELQPPHATGACPPGPGLQLEPLTPA